MQRVETKTMDDFSLGNFTGHGLSVAVILGSAAGIFPAVAALAAFVWYCIQIYSSTPVQRWLRTRRERRLAALKKELARLEAITLKNLDP